MKKNISFLLSIIALIMVGCGGGGSGGFIDIAAIIEHKDFYRYIEAEEKYLKELFDGNGTLMKEVYTLDNVKEGNSTSEYLIDGAYVYITENNVTERCRVEDNNKSVTFSCIEVGVTGAAVDTVRWFELDDALANPE
ncbi:hypothetical protein PGH07_10855 [Sulfurovum sp. zt1-1]|uniref:Ig-like domain-containing protein n=1 Tax=Sulfurovum zhangzhouensis TaxID=3019067 RepID=A0ABT7R0R8_9BACT|nr:hypothetical protein [Sulfurovum zhangzhouensis]MDM5272671.1 hypothetical protein [Sulfurovum zhangzhouensis]